MEVGVEFCGFVSGAVPNEIVGGFNQQIEKLFNFICISDTRNFHGNQREPMLSLMMMMMMMMLTGFVALHRTGTVVTCLEAKEK